MDFADGLPAKVNVTEFPIARDEAKRFFANDFGSLLGFGVDDDLVGTVNFVVRENTVLENEPATAPSFSVVNPLVKNSGDSVPDEVVDPDVDGGRREGGGVGSVGVGGVVGVAGGGIGSGGGGGGERRHEDGGDGRRGVIGDAAEGMH